MSKRNEEKLRTGKKKKHEIEGIDDKNVVIFESTFQ